MSSSSEEQLGATLHKVSSLRHGSKWSGPNAPNVHKVEEEVLSGPNFPTILTHHAVTDNTAPHPLGHPRCSARFRPHVHCALCSFGTARSKCAETRFGR